jgi:hypothetical protein
MSYERLIGVFARVPYKKGCTTLSKALRAAQMVQTAVSAFADDEHASAMAVYGPNGIELPGGPGFTHGIRCGADHTHSHVYAFTHDAAGVKAAADLHVWRTQAPSSILGHEAFPGALFNSGDPSSASTRPQRKRHFALLPAQLLANGALMPSREAIPRWPNTVLVHLSHVAQCLQVHYSYAFPNKKRQYVNEQLREHWQQQQKIHAVKEAELRDLHDVQQSRDRPTRGQATASDKIFLANREKRLTIFNGARQRAEDEAHAVQSPYVRAWYHSLTRQCISSSEGGSH